MKQKNKKSFSLRWSKVITILFFFYPFSYLVLPWWRITIGFPIYISDLLTFLLYLSLSVFHGWNWLNIKKIPSWALILSLLLFIGLFPSAFRYNVILDGVYEVLRFSIALWGFSLGVFLFKDDQNLHYRKALTLGFFTSIVIILLLMLFQYGNSSNYFLVKNLFYGSYSDKLDLLAETDGVLEYQSTRPSATFQGPTSLAGIALFATANIWLSCHSVKLFNPLLIRLSVLGGVLISVLTLSRHSLLAMLVSLPFFLFSRDLTGKTRKQSVRILEKFFIFILVSLLSLPMLISSTPVGENLTARLERGGIQEDYNLQARLIVGPQRVLNLIESDFSVLITGIGTGMRNVKDRQLARFVNDHMISNSFVIPLVYLGLFGFFIFLGFWLWNLKIAWPLRKTMSYNALGIVLMMFVIVASDNYSYNQKSAISMWSMLSGILGGLYVRQKQKTL